MSEFYQMSEIQKSLKFPMGRGGQAYLGIFPKFFRFIFMMAPLSASISTRFLTTIVGRNKEETMKLLVEWFLPK